jgi:hypothetical protein
MTSTMMRYDQMIDEALRGVVRATLRQVAKTGLPGEHHLFISFLTGFPGVELPDYLREKYPEEMTIVLQHQFWELMIERDFFSVRLSFQDIREKLVIPFGAVTSFADPAAKFGLQFKEGPEHLADDEEVSEPGEPTALPVAFTPPSPDEATDKPAAEVVTLDNFRRK